MAKNVKLGSAYFDIEGRDNLTDDLTRVKNTTKKGVHEIKREVDDLGHKANQTSGKMTNFFNGIKNNIVGVIGSLYLFKKAWDFSVVFKNAARDAAETENKFNEVFKGIETDGEATARALSDSFGLAKSTSQELLANVGDLLVGLNLNRSEALSLAKEVVALSADVTSFKNVQGGVTRATDALTKALLGEREMLKETFRTAVLENEVMERAKGILKERTQLTIQQAKALATLQIVTERNKDAIGDFKRTIDEQANSERILKEKTKTLTEQLGAGLLPAFNALTKAGIGWLTILNRIVSAQTGKVWSTEELKGYYNSIKDMTAEQLKAEEATMMKNLEASNKRIKNLKEYLSLLERQGKSSEVSEGKLKNEEKYNSLLLEQFRIVNDLRTGVDMSRFDPNSTGTGTQDEEMILKRQKAVKDYYENVKWLDAGYEEYKLQQFEKEKAAYIQLTNNKLQADREYLIKVEELYKDKAAFFDDPLMLSAELDMQMIDEAMAKDEERYQHQADMELWIRSLRAEALIEELDKRREINNEGIDGAAQIGYALDSALSRAGDGLWDTFRAILRLSIQIAENLSRAAETGSNPSFGIGASAIGLIGTLFGANRGATITNRGGNVSIGSAPRLATGGSFYVPPGYPNDSFPFFAQSGERVSVETTTQAAMNDRALGRIENAIKAMNQNMIMMSGQKIVVINNSRSAEAEVLENKRIENKLGKVGVKLDKL